MNKKESEFNKVFSAWDILVIAFGAMIGWGWVVSTGSWIEKGGVLGAALGFALGGVMIFFVGLTYAELTAAMPQCGGEHVFSHRAMGATGSFICTWAIVLGYVSVACFEACAFPTIITYLWPGFICFLACSSHYRSIYYYDDKYYGSQNSRYFTDSTHLYHRWCRYFINCSFCNQRYGG